MASDVDICNLALAHLGDSATVASIDPPEGSAQSEHCARWYPIARDSLLEMHDWPFAMRRGVLAQVTNPFAQWQYAYAYPSDALRIVAILAADAPDDYSVTYPLANSYDIGMNNQRGIYTPQRFDTETNADGNRIIVTNQVDAVVRYTRTISDTNKFSPLFRDTLATYLASYLAGPVIKGDSGIKIGDAKRQAAMGMVAMAKLSAGQQQRQDVGHDVPWLAGR